MMKARRRCVTAAVFVLAAAATTGTVAAQQIAAPTLDRFVDRAQGLSIEDAVRAAAARAPALDAARAGIDAARSRRRQAGLRPNPSFGVELREEIGGMDRMTGASASLPLDLFRRGSRIASAEAAVAVAEATASQRILDVEIEVRRQFGAVLAALRRLEVAIELEAAARRVYELLSARVNEGAAPPLDRDLAKVEAERAATMVASTVAQAEASRVQLAAALGEMPDRAPRVRESLEDVVVSLKGREAFDAAANVSLTRPDVRLADAAVLASTATIARARSEGRWDVSVSGGYVRMQSGFDLNGFDAAGVLRPIMGTIHNVTASAMVMVPLFNRNQGEVAAAESERKAAQAEAAAVRIDAASDLSRSAIELRSALEIVEKYRTSIVPQARANLATVTQRYELGRGTLFDVLQARQQVLQIQNEFTEALWRAYDAHVARIAATGGTVR